MNTNQENKDRVWSWPAAVAGGAIGVAAGIIDAMATGIYGLLQGGVRKIEGQ